MYMLPSSAIFLFSVCICVSERGDMGSVTSGLARRVAPRSPEMSPAASGQGRGAAGLFAGGRWAAGPQVSAARQAVMDTTSHC